ncbi:hypothetical protein GCM10012289_31440 [Nonomuraea cavernae]|uniref:Uncharacterized protein n=1 Tax=Nonomuraea cavernae TaxID=2045107 RepID=A0A917Z0K2_9ACTN|nr:hypothetical protein GCM10012289_31440 [Nonomuraea cavernae]
MGTSDESPTFRRERDRTPAEQGRGRRLAARRIAVETPRDTGRFGGVFDGGENQAAG